MKQTAFLYHVLQMSTIGFHTPLPLALPLALPPPPPPLVLSPAQPCGLTTGCHVDCLIVDVIGQ